MRASLPRSLPPGWHLPRWVGLWLQAALAILVLLAVAAFAVRRPAADDRQRGAVAALPLAQRAALEQCGESAVLLYDIRWAAACLALAENDPVRDGSVDCELPPALAQPLNLLLQEEEQRCLAEAKSGRPL